MMQDDIKEIIENKINNLFQIIDNSVLKLNYFSKKIENLMKDITMFKTQSINIINNKLQLLKQVLNSKLNIIKAHSQDQILERGYSIVYKGNKIINSSKDLKEKDVIDIKLYKSKVKAEVKEAK